MCSLVYVSYTSKTGKQNQGSLKQNMRQEDQDLTKLQKWKRKHRGEEIKGILEK